MKTGLRDRIGNLLIQRGLITADQLKQALELQKEKHERLGELLVSLGFISKDALLQALSEEMGIPSIALARVKIEPDVVKKISKKLADLHCILPVSAEDGVLSLAMSDPLNVHALDDVRRATGLEVKPLLAIDKDIRDAIEHHFGENVSEAIKDVMKDIAEDGSRLEIREGDFQSEGSAQDLLRLTEEEPIVKLTNSIMAEGVKRRSSDIFIEPEEKNLRVRFRVDGLLQEGLMTSRAMHAGVVSRIKVISDLDIAEHRIPQDGRFKMKIKDKFVDFRVSVLPTYFGEKVVLRILDKSGAVLDLEKLGFEPEPLEALKKAAAHPHGMIAVCGPTGAGKTTTLYSVLKLVDRPEINIVTVEDPVEFQIEGINQVAIRSEVDLTFARALRAILRQDPDVIMVGEIRDTETADVAIKAALTGHLVLSTLHATTAAGAVTRLLNMGIEPFLITSSVLLAGSQRLVRRICTKCREAHEPSKELLRELGVTDKDLKGAKPVFYRGKGCEHCHQKGYTGRAVLLEALSMSPNIKGMILKGAQEYELKRAGRAEGMLSLRENGIKKVLSGVTTPEEVMRVTVRDED